MQTKITKIDRALAASFLKLLPGWVTPNHLTIFRFLTVPFVVLFIADGQYGLGLALFVVSAFTDALDGALARTTNQITDWGKMFDPLADKLLIGSVVAVVVSKYINVYLAFVIISIEAILILSAYYRKKYKNMVIQAERTGKLKMVLQSFGVGFILLYLIFPYSPLLVVAEYTLYLSVVFALWSLVVYKAI